MHQPGVEVRPIRNLAGSSEFCEVYFDGARRDVVGDVDVGALGRGAHGARLRARHRHHQMQFEREVDDLIITAPVAPRTAHTTRRSATGSSKRGSACGYWRSTTIPAHSLHTPGTPGPSRPLQSSAGTRRVAPAALRAEARRRRRAALRLPRRRLRGASTRVCCMSLAETIYGGSGQIQRNTIGERVLGLPRSHARRGLTGSAVLDSGARRFDLLLADRVADLHVHHPELDARAPREIERLPDRLHRSLRGHARLRLATIAAISCARSAACSLDDLRDQPDLACPLRRQPHRRAPSAPTAHLAMRHLSPTGSQRGRHAVGDMRVEKVASSDAMTMSTPLIQ